MLPALPVMLILSCATRIEADRANYSRSQSYSPTQGPSSTMEERRASRRYKLSLRVEVWAESRPKNPQPTFLSTIDISGLGFYFESDDNFPVGSRLNFSIVFPQEITGARPEFVHGLAKIVRAERTAQDRIGVGIRIENYQMGAK